MPYKQWHFWTGSSGTSPKSCLAVIIRYKNIPNVSYHYASIATVRISVCMLQLNGNLVFGWQFVDFPLKNSCSEIRLPDKKHANKTVNSHLSSIFHIEYDQLFCTTFFLYVFRCMHRFYVYLIKVNEYLIGDNSFVDHCQNIVNQFVANNSALVPILRTKFTVGSKIFVYLR